MQRGKEVMLAEFAAKQTGWTGRLQESDRISRRDLRVRLYFTLYEIRWKYLRQDFCDAAVI
jgi:hypothetical protein